MCRRARLLLTIAFTSLFAVAVHAQLFDPNQDQPSTPFAQQVFSSAFPLECQVLQQFNPGISSCGVDTLIRNPTLLAWGLTTPVAPLITQTRYNPTSTQPLQNQFGPGATFFIFGRASFRSSVSECNGSVGRYVSANTASQPYSDDELEPRTARRRLGGLCDKTSWDVITGGGAVAAIDRNEDWRRHPAFSIGISGN